MQVTVGYSDHPDSISAGRQATQMALMQGGREQPCDMALLFGTARHDQQLLRSAVVSIVGDKCRIYGGGAAGVITNEYFGYAGDQVGIACIWLEDSTGKKRKGNGQAAGQAAFRGRSIREHLHATVL